MIGNYITFLFLEQQTSRLVNRVENADVTGFLRVRKKLE